MTEIAFTCRAAMGLNIVPQIIIRQLKDTRKELQKSSVDRPGEIFAKRLDLVQKRVKTFRGAVYVFPITLIPVELLNAIGNRTVTLTDAANQFDSSAHQWR